MIWRISKCAFSLSKKRHIWHHRLKNRAVSFCPMYHFAPVSPIQSDVALNQMHLKTRYRITTYKFDPKLLKFSYPTILTFILGAQKFD